MTEERKNPIIRREQITVAYAQQNQYGDLIVKTKAGNELKVGKKRQHLFNIFQPGIEVIVGFSSYMNKEYINEAAQASQVVSTDTPVKKESDHLVKDVKEAVKMNIAPQGKGMNPSKNKAFALSYAKDLATGGVIDNDSILKWADKFLEWLDKS